MAERTDERTREREDIDLDGLGDTEPDIGEIGDVGGDTDTTESGIGESIRGLGGDATDRETTAETETSTSSRLPSFGVRERVGSLFSARLFGMMLLVTTVLSLVAGAVVPFIPGNVAGLLGVFAAGFLLGAVDDDRHYLEVGLASAFAGVLTAVLGNLVLTVAGLGVPILAAGATASGVLGLLGHYVGRDLRDGLTREL